MGTDEHHLHIKLVVYMEYCQYASSRLLTVSHSTLSQFQKDNTTTATLDNLTYKLLPVQNLSYELIRLWEDIISSIAINETITPTRTYYPPVIPLFKVRTVFSCHLSPSPVTLLFISFINITSFYIYLLFGPSFHLPLKSSTFTFTTIIFHCNLPTISTL